MVLSGMSCGGTAMWVIEGDQLSYPAGNLFQLLSAAPRHDETRVSIPAKTLWFAYQYTRHGNSLFLSPLLNLMLLNCPTATTL